MSERREIPAHSEVSSLDGQSWTQNIFMRFYFLLGFEPVTLSTPGVRDRSEEERNKLPN